MLLLSFAKNRLHYDGLLLFVDFKVLGFFFVEAWLTKELSGAN